MDYASSVCVVDITRTADTNAYSGGDVIGSATSGGAAVLTLNRIGPVSGNAQVMITTSKLRIDVSAVPSGMTNFRLLLFASSPASALNDNDNWTFASGDRSAFLGFLDLGVPVDLGSTLYVMQSQNLQFTVPAGGVLYGYLQTTGAYTPSSADVFRIALNWVEV